ncbi:MAG: cell division protein FtsQ/DivIB, partial [Thermoanaerobaculia bacterium]
MSVAPVLPPAESSEEFRRSSAPPRRRRRNPVLALLRPLAVSLLLVAMPAGLVTWVLASPRFDLRNVEVSGTPRVPAEALRAAIAPFEGGNLVLLPLDTVEAAVRRNPWVDTVEVAKELPDRLRVEVTERRPVAL